MYLGLLEYSDVVHSHNSLVALRGQIMTVKVHHSRMGAIDTI